MDCKNSYDIALRIGEIAMKSLNFFIIICAAFGGWILAGDTIVRLDLFSPPRFLAAVAFTVSTLGITYGIVMTMKRMNSALELSNHYYREEHGEVPSFALPMFLPGNTKVSFWSMIGVILAIDALILLYDCSAITTAFNEACAAQSNAELQ